MINFSSCINVYVHKSRMCRLLLQDLIRLPVSRFRILLLVHLNCHVTIQIDYQGIVLFRQTCSDHMAMFIVSLIKCQCFPCILSFGVTSQLQLQLQKTATTANMPFLHLLQLAPSLQSHILPRLYVSYIIDRSI